LGPTLGYEYGRTLHLFLPLLSQLVIINADDWSDKASENSSTNDEGGSGMDADTDAGAPAASKPKKPSKTQHIAAVRKNHLNIVFIGHVGK